VNPPRFFCKVKMIWCRERETERGRKDSEIETKRNIVWKRTRSSDIINDSDKKRVKSSRKNHQRLKIENVIFNCKVLHKGNFKTCNDRTVDNNLSKQIESAMHHQIESLLLLIAAEVCWNWTLCLNNCLHFIR